jgi:hypothetical protein
MPSNDGLRFDDEQCRSPNCESQTCQPNGGTIDGHGRRVAGPRVEAESKATKRAQIESRKKKRVGLLPKGYPSRLCKCIDFNFGRLNGRQKRNSAKDEKLSKNGNSLLLMHFEIFRDAQVPECEYHKQESYPNDGSRFFASLSFYESATF